MRIKAYVTNENADAGWTLRPASPERAWMDACTRRWIYRCLPLVIANQCGWIVECPASFSAVWNGDAAIEGTRLRFNAEGRRWRRSIRSHFGDGVVTFSLPWLFRTEPGVALLVRGATNFWIDGAVPLDGIVEAWGLEATFTMNWKLTSPGRRVRFRAGDPICMIMPYPLEQIETAEPVVSPLAADPDLEERHNAWRESRAAFNADHVARRRQGWQKTYVRGTDALGGPVHEHRTRLHVPPFERREAT